MSSQPGFSVMLHALTDHSRDAEAYNVAKGKVITGLSMVNGNPDYLLLTFEDGKQLRVWDDGQSCCESRYMMTDDALEGFVGAKFLGIDLEDGPDKEEVYGDHETQFLLVRTDKGTFTCVTHNEHNGYYGGFAVRVEEVV